MRRNRRRCTDRKFVSRRKPCIYKEDKQPSTFDQVFQNIFEYIDHLFKIVRPRKLLFMAIDGVAPRAKMNQQRARRFRTAKDAEIADFEEEKLRKEFVRQGKKCSMDKLAKALEVYITSRLSSDPGWENLKVILSDANVPGEGEHKIMKFIRQQRTQQAYDPNTRHCLYGLDADLIMLALATHEPHFSILREDVLVEEKRPSLTKPSQKFPSEHNSGSLTLSEGCSKKWEAKIVSRKAHHKPYQFLNIWTLREYLELDLKVSETPSNFDFERVVDDFIFICFFTGNDFLPHMPSLEIRELGIDLLMAVYKDEFKSLGGYLVDTKRLQDRKAGYIKLKRLEKFILSIGTYEERIFKKRMELRQRMIRRLHQQMANDLEDLEIEPDEPFIHSSISDVVLSDTTDCCKERMVNVPISECGSRSSSAEANNDDVLKNTEDIKTKVKDIMREKSDLFKQGSLETDRIRLGQEGWKERYYKEKFAAEGSENIERIRKEVVEKYTEGLCWVLQYYFYGVRSWTWFYPYHYGPFASDLKRLGRVSISFSMGRPFRPFEQLMGSFLQEEESDLIDFYPTDFDVDIDGKRHLWQGVVKLPFIDEKRLLLETKKLENELKEDEVRRNSENMERIFVLSSHGLGREITCLYKKNNPPKPETEVRVTIDPCASGGLNGFISQFRVDPDYTNCTSYEKEMEETVRIDVICATFECPISCPHIPRLLENVSIPEKTITEADIVAQQLWHEYEGHRPANNRWFAERCRKERSVKNFASSDAWPGKESIKLAGSGWGAGRGKANVDTYYSPTYKSSRGRAPNNVDPPPSGFSLQTGPWMSDSGNTHLESSNVFSSANGRSYLQSTWKQNSMSLRPTQASSSSTLSTGKWVPVRGCVHSPSTPPRNSYITPPSARQAGAGAGASQGFGRRNDAPTPTSSNTQVNVGQIAPLSAGRGWEAASAGSGQGWGRGNGSYMPTTSSNTQVNVGKIATSSVGRGRGNDLNSTSKGRGVGCPGGEREANNNFWTSRNDSKKDDSSSWRNTSSPYG